MTIEEELAKKVAELRKRILSLERLMMSESTQIDILQSQMTDVLHRLLELEYHQRV